MKSNLIFCSLLALSLAITSCKKEEETEAAAADTTQQPLIVPNVQPIPAQPNVQVAPQPNQQVAMQAQNMPQAVTQAPVATKPGMNPPHGQAGHRCDIAVGAPLNSPAGKAPATQGKPAFTQTTIPTPATTTTTSSATPQLLKADAPVVTAPGMNPPHGQPGHVCGTPVGSALPTGTPTSTETK